MLERLKLAKIGNYRKWQSLIKKIQNDEEISQAEREYFSLITRIYKDVKVISRTKIYHTKLSLNDPKPKCNMCDGESSYYCNMNDAYFCQVHVIGHDENEL